MTKNTKSASVRNARKSSPKASAKSTAKSRKTTPKASNKSKTKTTKGKAKTPAIEQNGRNTAVKIWNDAGLSRKDLVFRWFLKNQDATPSQAAEEFSKLGVVKSTFSTWMSWWRNGKQIPKASRELLEKQNARKSGKSNKSKTTAKSKTTKGAKSRKANSAAA